METGWIKLYRRITDHWLWQDKPFSKGQAWADILIMANHDDNRFLLGNELVEVKRGSFITSELKLMERWGWSKSKVRSFLELLQNDNMLVKISDKKKTTITVVNYSDCQGTETIKKPQKDHKETISRPQKDTNKNEKNDKNEKNNIYSQFELEILDYYNSKNIFKHKETNALQKCIQASLKKYSVEDIKQAIDNYATVYQDKDYFYKHIWRLDKFLKQSNGVPEFLPDGQAWLNYKNRSSKPKPSAKPVNSGNFEQRQYDDSYYDSLYENAGSVSK